jgi:hypothetical protein
MRFALIPDDVTKDDINGELCAEVTVEWLLESTARLHLARITPEGDVSRFALGVDLKPVELRAISRALQTAAELIEEALNDA